MKFLTRVFEAEAVVALMLCRARAVFQSLEVIKGSRDREDFSQTFTLATSLTAAPPRATATLRLLALLVSCTRRARLIVSGMITVS